MKKITFYVFASMLCATMHAQFPFPTENAIWNVQRNISGYYYPEQIIYGIKGDTIIADKHYQKLYMLNDSLLIIDDKDSYYGAIRTEGEKVYFRSKENFYDPEINFETLLYDFSKQKGDIIEHGMVEVLESWLNDLLPIRTGFIKCVSTVRDIYYDQDGRKHLLLDFKMGEYDEGGSDEWIEGVGSTSGFFWIYRPHPICAHEYDFRLQCLKQNEELKYLIDNYCNKCFCRLEAGTITKIKEIREDNSISVNISNGNINVHLRDDITDATIKFLDVNGILIRIIPIKESCVIIPVREFEKGIYIYQVLSKTDVVQSGKLIVK